MSKKFPANILIVDDDTDILLTARMVLKRQFTEIQIESDPHKIGQRLASEVFPFGIAGHELHGRIYQWKGRPEVDEENKKTSPSDACSADDSVWRY